jgi:hypothetical protein
MIATQVEVPRNLSENVIDGESPGRAARRNDVERSCTSNRIVCQLLNTEVSIGDDGSGTVHDNQLSAWRTI